MADSLSRRRLAAQAARLNAAHRMAGMLPPLVLMTDDARFAGAPAAARALPPGSLVVIRARDAARRAALLQAMPRDQILVIVADDPDLARHADGLHLPEAKAHQAAHWRARHPHWLLTAASHGAAASNPHLDLVFLSPVFPTRSHPGRSALGAVRANAIARASQTPVYALGGIDAQNASLLHGFAGIAAIGALDTE